ALSCALSPTWHAIAAASPPAALIAAAVSSHAACLRLEITTCAPHWASAAAIARPMPRDEPVITAVLPERSKNPMPAPAKALLTMLPREAAARYPGNGGLRRPHSP